MARRGYPPELRRNVLDLLASGRKVADAHADSRGTYGARRVRAEILFASGAGTSARDILGRPG
jgi:hypothetical protein